MRFARIFTAVLFLTASAVLAQLVTAGGTGPSEHPSRNVQSEALPPQAETYGTSSLSWMTLNMLDFRPLSSTTAYDYDNATASFGIYRVGTTGHRWFEGPLHLPAGAIVSTISLSGCDTNATQNISAYFAQVSKQGVYTNPGSVPVASTTGATGCQVVTGTNTPFTVDNDANTYMVEVDLGTAGDTSLVLVSLRVGYTLQVSPAPATATFGDVPTTHLFFQYVEALAAAGITSGCGGGNFSPMQQ